MADIWGKQAGREADHIRDRWYICHSVTFEGDIECGIFFLFMTDSKKKLIKIIFFKTPKCFYVKLSHAKVSHAKMSHYSSYAKVSHAKVDTTPKCSTPKCSICQSGNMSKYHPRQSGATPKCPNYPYMSKWFHAKVATTSNSSCQSVPRQSISRQNVCQPILSWIFLNPTMVRSQNNTKG